MMLRNRDLRHNAAPLSINIHHDSMFEHRYNIYHNVIDAKSVSSND
jgi:hypothetical protein